MLSVMGACRYGGGESRGTEREGVERGDGLEADSRSAHADCHGEGADSDSGRPSSGSLFRFLARARTPRSETAGVAIISAETSVHEYRACRDALRCSSLKFHSPTTARVRGRRNAQFSVAEAGKDIMGKGDAPPETGTVLTCGASLPRALMDARVATIVDGRG